MKTKKYIQLLLIALMFMPTMANAFTGTAVIDGINYYIVTKGQTAEVRAKSPNYTGDIVIPETVEYEGVTCRVTSIGDQAFYNCYSLTSVTIPNSVTSIGNSAFLWARALTSITIPNSVASIGNSAFYGCSGLISVTIPNSVTSIGNEAFGNCTSLTSFTIPNSVTSIGSAVFSGCSGLTSFTIPNSVTSIGGAVFYGCSDLTSIIVNSGNPVYDSRNNCNAIIRTTDNVLIAGCQNTTIPNSVISIGGGAFYGCTSLTSVTIPNSVASIGNSAFRNCSSLTSVTIPNSVTSIEDLAFEECTNLTSVTIPNSVTSIGDGAFANCQELLDVYCYAEAVPSTEINAFDGSYPEYATLHVPAVSLEAYRTTIPWSSFGTFMTLDGDIPVIEKCATPTITYVNGKIRFACETEDVEFVRNLSFTSNQLPNGNEMEIGGTFTVSVYATKEGYDDSDVATMTINLGKMGDFDGDGQLTVTDVTSLVNAILGK